MSEASERATKLWDENRKSMGSGHAKEGKHRALFIEHAAGQPVGYVNATLRKRYTR